MCLYSNNARQHSFSSYWAASHFCKRQQREHLLAFRAILVSASAKWQVEKEREENEKNQNLFIVKFNICFFVASKNCNESDLWNLHICCKWRKSHPKRYQIAEFIFRWHQHKEVPSCWNFELRGQFMTVLVLHSCEDSFAFACTQQSDGISRLFLDSSDANDEEWEWIICCINAPASLVFPSMTRQIIQHSLWWHMKSFSLNKSSALTMFSWRVFLEAIFRLNVAMGLFLCHENNAHALCGGFIYLCIFVRCSAFPWKWKIAETIFRYIGKAFC